MEYTMISTVVLLLVCSFAFLPTISGLDEKRLSKLLLQSYKQLGTNGRPVTNYTDQVEVNLGFSLLKLVDFNQERQELSLIGWLELDWDDIMLRWVPDDFGQVQRLSVPAASIWTPDIVLLNSFETPQLLDGQQAAVTSEGHVTWVRQMSIKVFCYQVEDDTDKDIPSCQVKFGTWTLTEDMMKLTPKIDRMDLSHYARRPDWELYLSEVTVPAHKFPCCFSDSFPTVIYTIKLRAIPQKDDLDDDKDNGASALSRFSLAGAVSLPIVLALH